MKIELNIDRGEKQREFFDYLVSALRENRFSYQISSGIDAYENFVCKIEMSLRSGDDTYNLIWRFKFDSNGKLLSVLIENEKENQNNNDVRWEELINKIVYAVLTSALAKRRAQYYHRSIYHYIGQQIDGEYWLQGFRFAPVLPDDAGPYDQNAERIVCFDQEVEAIDEEHATILADANAGRNAARLSFILDIGLYRTRFESLWVLPCENDRYADKSVRYQLSFMHPLAKANKMPKKGQLGFAGKYKRNLEDPDRGELLSMPPETRKILRCLEKSGPKLIDAFDRATRLYQFAAVCGRYYPSAKLAYRVAAIDALCKADQEYRNDPRGFMLKYLGGEKYVKEMADLLYGDIRSAHFHGGEFPLGEFKEDRFLNPVFDRDYFDTGWVSMIGLELTRRVIVNWVRRVVLDENCDITTKPDGAIKV